MICDCAEDVLVDPSECFAADFDARFVVDLLDDDAGVADGRHVYGSVSSPKAHQVVAEDDIHGPKQPALDASGRAQHGRSVGR